MTYGSASGRSLFFLSPPTQCAQIWASGRPFFCSVGNPSLGFLRSPGLGFIPRCCPNLGSPCRPFVSLLWAQIAPIFAPRGRIGALSSAPRWCLIRPILRSASPIGGELSRFGGPLPAAAGRFVQTTRRLIAPLPRGLQAPSGGRCSAVSMRVINCLRMETAHAKKRCNFRLIFSRFPSWKSVSNKN